MAKLKRACWNCINYKGGYYESGKCKLNNLSKAANASCKNHKFINSIGKDYSKYYDNNSRRANFYISKISKKHEGIFQPYYSKS